KRLLSRPKVREVQKGVRREHPNRRDAGKVVPLGDQLRSDQAGDSSGQNVLDDGGRSAPARRVAVEHRVRDSGKELREPVADALGTGSDGLQDRAATVGAARGTPDAFSAVMANQRPPAVMNGSGNAAARASEVVAAGAAEEERGEPAARLKEDRLLSAR